MVDIGAELLTYKSKKKAVLSDNRAFADAGDNTWTITRSGAQRQSEYFEKLLDVLASENNVSFKELPRPLKLRYFVEQLQKTRPDFLVIEPMSYGALIRDLGVCGIAMGLVDNRTQLEKNYDADHHIGFVAGDIVSRKTWIQTKKQLEQMGRPHADLIIVHPVGGIGKIPSDPLVYYDLLRQMYSLLRPDGGILLTQYYSKMEPFISQAVKKLDRLPHIHAGLTHGSQTSQFTFFLQRNAGAPEKLPSLSFFGTSK